MSVHRVTLQVWFPAHGCPPSLPPSSPPTLSILSLGNEVAEETEEGGRGAAGVAMGQLWDPHGGEQCLSCETGRVGHIEVSDQEFVTDHIPL